MLGVDLVYQRCALVSENGTPYGGAFFQPPNQVNAFKRISKEGPLEDFSCLGYERCSGRLAKDVRLGVFSPIPAEGMRYADSRVDPPLVLVAKVAAGTKGAWMFQSDQVRAQLDILRSAMPEEAVCFLFGENGYPLVSVVWIDSSGKYRVEGQVTSGWAIESRESWQRFVAARKRLMELLPAAPTEQNARGIIERVRLTDALRDLGLACDDDNLVVFAR